MPRTKLLVAGLVAVAVVVATAAVLLRRPGAPAAYSADVVGYLSADATTDGFARVTGPREFVLPEDAGPHPAYQTEWWYYTGNLADDDGQRYGFQLTFFRRALAANAAERPSDWGTNQVYLAHFAVTDAAGGTFHSAERLARGAAGLAGARAAPFRVWTEDWSATQTGPEPGKVRLVAADGAAAIDLTLTPRKRPAAHGQAGFSRKGPEPGNASYYYSYSRMGATGTLTSTTGSRRVAGTAWMDHEWSTSALGAGQVGWDWFSLQLDDRRELMLFQIRQADGGIAEESSGSLVDAAGAVTPLDRDAFTIEATGRWRSPRTGGEYPSGWRVRVPAAGLDLAVTPLLADQELSTGLRYWEGASRVEGRAGGKPVAGHGYVELTGYAGGADAPMPGLP
jgi:predicted secreted hydrolase